MPSQQPLAVAGQHRSEQQLADIRRTAVLRRLGLQMREIAEAEGITISGVYLRIKRARELGLLDDPPQIRKVDRAQALLEACLPFVDAFESEHARRLVWAIQHPEDPRATAEAVAARVCPAQERTAA